MNEKRTSLVDRMAETGSCHITGDLRKCIEISMVRYTDLS